LGTQVLVKENWYYTALVSTRESFVADVVPLLDGRGCGPQAWISRLKADGKWSG
jgi:hypothetical protein